MFQPLDLERITELHNTFPNILCENNSPVSAPNADPLHIQFDMWKTETFQEMEYCRHRNLCYLLFSKNLSTRNAATHNYIVVYDINERRFAGQVTICANGSAKHMFMVSENVFNGPSFVVVVQDYENGNKSLRFLRIDLEETGLTSTTNPRLLLNAPLLYDTDMICMVDTDTNYLIILFGQQLTVAIVDINNNNQEPVAIFYIQNASISHFHTGFCRNAKLILFATNSNRQVDFSRLHIINLQTRQLHTKFCNPDPEYGLPVPRQGPALSRVARSVVMGGGTGGRINGNDVDLVDYWAIDILSLEWECVRVKIPSELVEPRLFTDRYGNAYIWGDVIVSPPDMVRTSHFCIYKLIEF